MMEIDYIEKIIKDGHALTDEVIAKHLKENHISYICRKGCSICCENMELPVLIFEMVAIRAYIKRLNNSELKNELINNIKKFDRHQHECPFLVNKICGVYEVRPIVCRIFYMKTKECISGEKWESRFEDIVTSFDKSELLDAIKCFYKLYGHRFEDENSFRQALDNGFFEDNTRSLYDLIDLSIIM